MTAEHLTYEIVEGVPSIELLDRLILCSNACIEPSVPAHWQKKLAERNLVLSTYAAKPDGEIVGYKVGYELKPKLFYSWVGGVVPSQRQQGIGSKLLEMQHEWLKTHGYDAIRTITDNRYREMIIRNLRAGFDICETKTDEAGRLRLVMAKQF